MAEENNVFVQGTFDFNTDSFAEGTRRVKEGFDDIGDAGEQSARRSSKAFDKLERQLEQLVKAGNAAVINMRKIGAADDTMAGFQSSMVELVRRMHDFDAASDVATASDAQFRRSQKLTVASLEETNIARRAGEAQIRAVTKAEQAAVSAQHAFTQRSAAEMNAAAAQRRAQTNLEIAALQQQTAAQRDAARVQVASVTAAARESAAAQRTRVEVIRQVGRQIIQIERAIAAAVRGTAAGMGRILSAVGTGTGRLAGMFRRSNNEFNEGLNGALIQREQSISRSFRRQQATMQASLAQQSAILDRFERQASTGVAGIASGRSRLGSLLGGGLAVGGGFVLAQKLRDGFQEAVNVTEAMNAMTLTFGTAAEAINAFADTSVEALFMTKSEALAAATTMGIFGKSAGLVGPELAAFSTELVTLATDLSSFYNTSPADAVTAIGAALRGEQEPIRRYGVLLNETVLQQRAFSEGITESIRKLTPQERVLAAQIEILAQTTDAQGDAARTADQFANSSRRARAASITMFAEITKAAVPVFEFLLIGIIPALEKITDLITGNVDGAMKILRDGLIGAGAALTGLLAAKVAGEALQFLAIGLRAVLTPMGAIITAITLAGAAFAILRNRVPAVGEGFDRLRDIVTGGLGRGLEFVTRWITRLVEGFIELLPVIIGVAQVLGRRIVGPLRDLGETIAGFVVPQVQRLVGALFTLGGAIGDAFRGDFGGLANIADSAVDAFSSLGRRILGVVQSGMAPVISFLSGIFGRINFEQVAVDILKVINEAGRLLGSFITSPGFITAVTSIAAAAAVLAGSFLLGFVEGVVKGLPGAVGQIFDMLGGALEAGGLPGIISGAFSNAFTGIPALLGAALLGRTLFTGVRASFQRAGEQGAASFGQGLARGARNWAGVVTQGSAGVTAAMDRSWARTTNAMVQNVNTLERRMAALGQTVNRSLGTGNAQHIRNLERSLQGVTNEIGRAATQSALFRSNVRSMFTGFDAAGQAVTKMQALRNTFADAGGWATVGRTAGIAVVGAMGAAMAGSQGFTGTAFMGIVAAGLTTALTTGNVAAGAAVAGVGLLVAAWNNGKRKAEEFRVAVTNLTTALLENGDAAGAFNTNALLPLLKSTPDLVKAMNAAGISIPQMSAALRGTEADAEAMAVKIEDALTVMGLGGFYAEDLGNKVRGLGEQYRGAAAAEQELIDAGYRNATAMETEGGLIERASRIWALYRGELDKADAAGGRFSLSQLRIRDNTENLFTDISSLVQRAGGNITDVFDYVVEEAERLDIEIDLTWLRELVSGTEEGVDDYYTALAGINEAWDDVSANIDPAAEAAAASFREFEESIQESFAKAASHIFSFKAEADSSLDDWQESLITNAQEVDTWQKNLSAIYTALEAEGRENSEEIVKHLAEQGPAMSGLIQQLIDDLDSGGTEWGETMDAITLAAAVAERDVTGEFATMGQGVLDGIGGIKGPLRSELGNQAKIASGSAAAIGDNIMSGISSGIIRSQHKATTQMRLSVAAVIRAGQSAAEAHSPSEATKRLIGDPLIQGVAAGIIAGTPEAQIEAALAVGEITEEMADQMKENVRLEEEARNMTEKVADAIIDAWEENRDRVIDSLEAVLEAAEDRLGAAWEAITDRFSFGALHDRIADAKEELADLQAELAAEQALVRGAPQSQAAARGQISTAQAALAAEQARLDAHERSIEAAEERVRQAELAVDDPTLTFLQRSQAQQALLAAQNALDDLQDQTGARRDAVSEAEQRVEDAVRAYEELLERINEARESIPDLQDQIDNQRDDVRDTWFEILERMIEDGMESWRHEGEQLSLDQVRQLAGITSDEFMALMDAIRTVERAEQNLATPNLFINFPQTLVLEVEGQPFTATFSAETLALLEQLEVTIGP